jgi:outer membrane protein
MKNLFLLITMCVVGMGVWAEEALSPGRLSLDQARERAASSSAALSRLAITGRNAALDARAENFSFLPTLSAGLSASMTLLGSRSLAEGLGAGSGTAVADSSALALSANVTQTIFDYDGGKRGIRGAIRDLADESLRQEALAAYFTVIGNADTYYYNVLEAEAAQESARVSLEAAEINLAIAEVRQSGGMISVGDYLDLRAKRESARIALTQASRNLSVARAKLRQLLDLPELPGLEEVDFSAYEDLIQSLAALDGAALEALEGALQGRSMLRNPGLNMASISSRTAERNVDMARRGYIPTVSASASAGLSYSVLNNSLAPSGSISIKGTIPLDFWVTALAVERAQNSAEQSRMDLRSSRDSLELEVETAGMDLVIQAASILAARLSYEYAEQSYQYQEELFRLSRLSALDISQAVIQRGSAHNQLITSQYNFLRGLAAIRSLGAFELEEDLGAFLLGAM